MIAPLSIRPFFRLFGCLGVWLAPLTFASESGAKENNQGKWGWFSASSTVSSWSTEQGTTVVDIKGDTISASLVDSISHERISFRGTIKGATVNGVATPRESDDSPARMSGAYGKTKWSGEPQREAIILHEVGKPWGLTIGITRDTPK